MAITAGKYLLQFGITANTFTLSDASRNESQGPTGQDPAVTLLSGKYGGSGVYFEFEHILKIKRARVDSVGAPGLQRPYIAGASGSAASLYINFKAVDGSDTPCGGLQLIIPNYNKWFDVEASARPFETSPAPVWTTPQKPYKLSIASQSSFNYDGYNISSDYVGQDWRPVVTLEVETGGIYDYSLHLI